MKFSIDDENKKLITQQRVNIISFFKTKKCNQRLNTLFFHQLLDQQNNN